MAQKGEMIRFGTPMVGKPTYEALFIDAPVEQFLLFRFNAHVLTLPKGTAVELAKLILKEFADAT